MPERKISNLFENLARKNSFFAELKNRIELNSVWREAAGDFFASRTHVASGDGTTLEVWTNDSTLLSELRFRTEEFLGLMAEHGFPFKKLVVKRFKG